MLIEYFLPGWHRAGSGLLKWYNYMWVRCCLILHNMIIEIEEDLGVHSSNNKFMQEAATWGVPLVNEGDDQGEDFFGSPGQIFCTCLVERLFHSLEQ